LCCNEQNASTRSETLLIDWLVPELTGMKLNPGNEHETQ
jgi:hypothetical protein